MAVGLMNQGLRPCREGNQDRDEGRGGEGSYGGQGYGGTGERRGGSSTAGHGVQTYRNNGGTDGVGAGGGEVHRQDEWQARKFAARRARDSQRGLVFTRGRSDPSATFQE